MRAAFSLSRHLRSRLAPLSSHLHLSRLHTIPSTPPPPPPTSQILNTDTQNATAAEPPTQTIIQDEPMTEFLSRFVHALRPKLAEAFPGLARNVLDQMLLLVCRKVVCKMDGNEAVGEEDESVELSEDLWKTVWEVSKSVHEAMKRDRMRAELKKYVHCDEVKQMCRFAADIGIKGSLLRELRFKWAREKLEEDKFYLNLEKMREQGNNQDTETARLKLTTLPQRKGEIKYKIYGLDLSDPKWTEIAERVEASEKEFVKEEPKFVEGKCRRIEEKLKSLDVGKEDLDLDLGRLVGEWKEKMEGIRRVDWEGLLERVKERSLDVYFKVAELLLNEETFEPTIRDYTRLIDLHSKSNRVKDAERILNKMIEAGFQPDTLTSIMLVHMYGQIGNLNLAKQHFATLKETGFKPDFKLYNSMINACIKAREPLVGLNLLVEMEDCNIKPSMENYLGILRVYGELGQVEGVQKVIDRMQYNGLNPNLEAYNILIKAYGESNLADHVDNARGQFDQMIRMGHKPDDLCTSTMIKAYMNKNMLDRALDLLLTLEKDGFKMGVKTYTVLLEWFGRLGLVEEAEQVVGRIRDETGSDPLDVHVSLCSLYARVRVEEKVRESIRVLEGKKKELKSEQFEKVLSGLMDGGFTEEVKRVCNWMRARGLDLPESVKVALPLMTGRKGFR
ncbi:hypothetical protein LUZ60_017550 [Juncus effusus]|nr:hypothetical protein LUZ60_017550 [Juncus effusus]